MPVERGESKLPTLTAIKSNVAPQKDQELLAMQKVLDALKPLTSEQISRVLAWVQTRVVTR